MHARLKIVFCYQPKKNESQNNINCVQVHHHRAAKLRVGKTGMRGFGFPIYIYIYIYIYIVLLIGARRDSESLCTTRVK